jgi:hypothetical protein
MNRYFFVAIAVALSACASISNDETSVRRVSIEEQKGGAIESQFTSDEPSAAHLRAFERRAMEKLKDFGDYLAIISDQSYEAEFRQKALVQARRMFIDHSNIRLSINTGQKIDIFLAELQEHPLTARVIISDIAIGDPLKETIAALYEGSLLFNFKILENESGSTGDKSQMKAEFFLMKTPKLFGTTQKIVWEIFLGDIYLSN